LRAPDVTKRAQKRLTLTATFRKETDVLDTTRADRVTAQLDRILTSPPLESSPSLCRFLRYVVEETLAGRGSSLKEYSLGVMVFDRGEAFDPRMDPIVRVQARNLRVRLAQYYGGQGADDAIVIELPKRTYVPVFHDRMAEEQAAAPPVPEAAIPSPQSSMVLPEVPAPPMAIPIPVGGFVPPPPPRRWPIWLLAAVFVFAAAASATLWHTHSRPTRSSAVHEPVPAAQDLYIRGRYLMDRQTEQALRESITCFRGAIERDPQFAPAYAGMAEAFNILAQFGYISPREGMGQARYAAEQALAIDASLAEAHVALAAIIEAYDWNWSAAEREYRRALALNPSLPAAHLWYGMFLRDQGRLQEALPELRRAAQLEPFSLLTSVNLADAYLQSGNYGAAVQEARHVTEVAPDLVMAECFLAHLYGARAQTAEAEAALERGLRFSKDDPHALSMLAKAYARQGKREQSVRLYRRLDELAKQRYVSPFDLGTVSLALGDEKRGADLLEEAFRQRSAGLICLRDAKFAGAQTSPQLHSLIERMRFTS
jgi:Tfp pilus assembly protein PilF